MGGPDGFATEFISIALLPNACCRSGARYPPRPASAPASLNFCFQPVVAVAVRGSRERGQVAMVGHLPWSQMRTQETMHRTAGDNASHWHAVARFEAVTGPGTDKIVGTCTAAERSSFGRIVENGSRNHRAGPYGPSSNGSTEENGIVSTL
jgi:hypothetical protein